MTASRRGLPIWAGRLLWFGAGLVAAWLLVADPLGLVDRSGGRDASGADGVAADGDMEQAELWTCPMHPHVLEEDPGDCPVCGMRLVRVAPPEDGTESGRRVLFYRHPMDPTVTSPEPARDEMGMDYVPVYADEADGRATGPATVRIDPGVVQNMNVQSVAAVRRDLDREIRTVGYLEYDQERMVSVTTKYSGWVEKVYANYVGEPVTEGQPLLEIYSPELVQTQQELLSAIEYLDRLADAPGDARSRAAALVDAGRTRLGYWDISREQIDELVTTREIFRTLQVVAPASGVIMQRAKGLEGMAVTPGMEIFHIADLSTLWLSVEVFENQMAWIEVGTPAEVSFTYFPGESFRGTVRFVEPEFSEQTRTLRVKLEVPNSRGRLK